MFYRSFDFSRFDLNHCLLPLLADMFPDYFVPRDLSNAIIFDDNLWLKVPQPAISSLTQYSQSMTMARVSSSQYLSRACRIARRSASPISENCMRA